MSQTTIIPHSQKPLVTRTYPLEHELDAQITLASVAQKQWRGTPLAARIEIGRKFMARRSFPASPHATSLSQVDCIKIGKVRNPPFILPTRF